MGSVETPVGKKSGNSLDGNGTQDHTGGFDITKLEAYLAENPPGTPAQADGVEQSSPFSIRRFMHYLGMASSSKKVEPASPGGKREGDKPAEDDGSDESDKEGPQGSGSACRHLDFGEKCGDASAIDEERKDEGGHPVGLGKAAEDDAVLPPPNVGEDNADTPSDEERKHLEAIRVGVARLWWVALWLPSGRDNCKPQDKRSSLWKHLPESNDHAEMAHKKLGLLYKLIAEFDKCEELKQHYIVSNRMVVEALLILVTGVIPFLILAGVHRCAGPSTCNPYSLFGRYSQDDLDALKTEIDTVLGTFTI